jgi:hypothetical protein
MFGFHMFYDYVIDPIHFSQVMLLNESSLIREAERRSLTQENIQNKENRMFGRGGPRFPGPDFREPEMLGPDTGNGPIFELDVPPAAGRLLGVSPHKNDLPLADPADLVEIAKDPTKSMHIDGKSRSIRHYGETATIVLEDGPHLHGIRPPRRNPSDKDWVAVARAVDRRRVVRLLL